MIKEGDIFPEGQLYSAVGGNAVKNVNTLDYCNGNKIIIGIPAAFTPTNTQNHIRDIVEHIDYLNEIGYTTAIMCRDDPFILKYWTGTNGLAGRADVFCDFECQVAKSLGLVMDYGVPLGIRSYRFTMIINNRTISKLLLDKSGYESTKPENVLKYTGVGVM